MISLDRAADFMVTPAAFAAGFEREPFAFEHTLSTLDVFDLANIEKLARRYRREDYFVAAGAATAATEFYSVAHDVLEPHVALARLDASNQRVLLKRPEKYDVRFRELLDGLFATVQAKHGRSLGRVVRLQSSILVSSSATITPFHFDPEVTFFFQIAGPKTYHLYSPSALSEIELERFYKRGVVDIAQVDLAGRDPAREFVFELGPGKGMHQPRNAGHWVQTQASRSISYVISYETAAMRATDRTRAFNFYLRQIGGRPAPVGKHPRLDTVKACVVAVSRPLRDAMNGTLRRQWHR